MNIDLLKLFLISCVIAPHVHVFPDIHVKKVHHWKVRFFPPRSTIDILVQIEINKIILFLNAT